MTIGAFASGSHGNLVIGTSQQGGSRELNVPLGQIGCIRSARLNSEVTERQRQLGIQQRQRLENGGRCDRSWVCLCVCVVGFVIMEMECM